MKSKFGPFKIINKPVQKEAMLFEYSEEGIAALNKFAGDNLGTFQKDRHIGALSEVEIKTLEDGTNLKVKHIATEGDYIVKGLNDEFYAVKPYIFKKTYTIVE